MTRSKSFEAFLDKYSRTQGYYKTFEAFLNVTLCMFQMRMKHDDVTRAKSQFGDEFISDCCDVLIAMGEEAEKGPKFADLLGDSWMEHCSNDRAGQFFTPEPICDMMALITCSDLDETKSICDPACGSGRTLLSAAKLSGGKGNFFAADIDPMCVKITVFNMYIWAMEGEVAWMNTLTYEHWKSYVVKRSFPIPMVVYELTPEQSGFSNRLKHSVNAPEPTPDDIERADPNGPVRGNQILLF